MSAGWFGWLAIFSGLFLAGNGRAADSASKTASGTPFSIPSPAGKVMENYCYDCHDKETTKGDVRLDNLAELDLDARLDLLNRVQEQVHFEEMPPKKKKGQPTEEERNQLIAWISGELRVHNASKLEDKLRMPEYGNVVNHEKLFSGKYKDLPGFTPDRRWLVSEFIFDDKINRLTGANVTRKIDGKGYQVKGATIQGITLTNPFPLPGNSGVRYYDTGAMSGGHLLTMIANAKTLSAFMINRAKKKECLPAIEAIMKSEWAHEQIIANREMYLNAAIEPLLAELYKEKNPRLLPVFVAVKPAPVQGQVDGKAKGPEANFDTGLQSRDDKDAIMSAIRKFPDAIGEPLVVACEKDWFYSGVNERTILLRVTFMRNFIDAMPKKRMERGPNPPPRPLAAPEMEIIRTAILKHRQPGDRYNQIIAKCVDDWKEGFRQERLKMGETRDAQMEALVEQVFTLFIERSPTPEEKADYVALAKTGFQTLGNERVIAKIIEAIMLRTDFVYRQEFGQGAADEHGRKMLSPHDASYALAYALTDSSPDKELQEAAKNGRLSTREDYRREVERMLKNRSQYSIIDESVDTAPQTDSITAMPVREIRFFREFFGYPHMLTIFKDTKRFGTEYLLSAKRLVSEADMLVGHILEGDKNVFEKLLTTEDFYVFHSGDNKAMAASAEHLRKICDYFKDKDWKNFDLAKLKEHSAFLKEVPIRGVSVDALYKEEQHSKYALTQFKASLESYFIRLDKGQTAATPYPVFSSHDATEARTRTGKSMANVGVTMFFNVDLANWSYPTTQPAKMPHRKGMLTHPAWLTAFAANTATDPVRRGKWVREKLLAGTIPDVPITVDAVIPEDHTKTLRSRLDAKTKDEYCWKCHERMNPLGLTFEMYDDFGRFRTEESLEHPDNLLKKIYDKGPPHADLRDIYKILPVVAAGHLAGTGDTSLDGDVKDAIDLTTRLSKSARVRQSIIRHAFRYFMGRNEMLSDSKTLMEADQAYLDSGGSFNAVILSLLTSDSFIYHKASANN